MLYQHWCPTKRLCTFELSDHSLDRSLSLADRKAIPQKMISILSKGDCQ